MSVMSEQPETESQPLSIEERLAAQFEPEQPEEQQQEQPPEEQQADSDVETTPDFVEVDFDGETYQVPPKLKDALLRQSDYTKKTTEVSQRQQALEQKELQIKAVESERQFHEAVKPDIAQIQEIDFQIKQWKAVDVTGMSSEQMWQLKTQLDNLKEKREELARGIDGKWRGWQQHQNALLTEAKQKATEYVSKAIKGWGPELQKALTDYGVAEGYTSEELNSLSMDARIVKTLWKAHQYDKAQQQLANGKLKVTPTVKPGSSNPMPQQVRDQFALKKQLNNPKLTSSQKAKAIERELMNRF